MATLLAFDTATERTHIGLEVAGRIWQHEADGGARASASFLPLLQEVLAQAGVALPAVDAIAFGRGPGAFTGLRVACSVAQGLALAVHRPVLPIDTLLALAEDARQACSGRRDRAGDQDHPESETAPGAVHRVWAVIDARMGEIYAAQYRHDAGGWTVLDAPELLTPEALNQRWLREAPELVAGHALSVFGDRLLTQQARVVPDAAPRGAALLSLARAQWGAGAGVDAALALPLYVRDKVAETSAERAARALAPGSP